ncbi:hypothetical protein HYFRA_00013440 [Hymenoscyphus fraxineus]|uniref:Lysine-specific metallo-endopeptidase domain-containing protein n=1 Tax=Hymenoscyphus fraxineus TaxID=746836 RepID=A0A9N9LC02_9HELO|nr:hypothetical protein HYFRA_00013440 [Hymenoscyphus fraxineus]
MIGNRLLLLSILFLGTYADIYTRFRVALAPGPVTRSFGLGQNYGGSCYHYNANLAAIYAEAIDMAQVAVTALETYNNNRRVRATLQTFFGIRPGPDGISVASNQLQLFNDVKAAFQDIIADSTNTFNAATGTPSLFCDGSWRWMTKMLYDRTTGAMTGRTLESELIRLGRSPDEVRNAQSNWAPFFKTYAGSGPGCTKNTLALTSYGTVGSITLCPRTWKDKTSLSDWRTGVRVINTGTALKQAQSIPSTLLHELCHLTSGGTITDEKITIVEDGESSIQVAYGPKNTALLALENPRKAVLNADSYRWFATAIYLGNYDWSRTNSNRNPAANVKRDNATSYDGEELRIVKRFMRKTSSERRQINLSMEDETDEKDWAQFQ